MREESTSKLMDMLKRVDVTEVENFRKKHALKENEGFPAFMDERIREQKILRKELIRQADFPEKYGYKLLSGESHTTERDYILRFCFALGLNLKDTQRALKLYGMRELYAKDSRDIVLIVAVNKKLHSVDGVNELLKENGQEPLKESRR
ncbi:MAG: hypothetical protein IKR59_03375 [Lachnospiraceae bacterium]|nr:hypothetical protein [Lachnospiraceae bacterium]